VEYGPEAVTVRFALHDKVWKAGAGYEGPGAVVAVFKSWMGDHRYVVEHRIAGGRGMFYHVYSAKELRYDPGPVAGESVEERSA
jgi:hypothetical protein